MRRLIASSAMCLALAAPAEADLYALVIGVDKYDHLPDLAGAVNDAMDIAEAVGGLEPAELRILLNHEASREAIIANWTELAKAAGPDDTLLVTYAGHGGTEPSATGNEGPNGEDENLLLSGFDNAGLPAGQRIRDDEIAGLIALEQEAQVVFVADSCHSGSVFRQAKGRVRFSDPGRIVDDPLPPLKIQDLPDYTTGQGTVFFGAVPETELVYEISEGNRARGALSLAFASGLRGAADTDGNGRIDKGELEVHVRRTVHRRTDGGQFPIIEPAGATANPLFALEPTTDPGKSPLNPFSVPFAELPKVPLDIIGANDPDLLYGRIDGVIPRQAPDERLTWDVAAGEVYSTRGELIANVPAATDRPAATMLSDVQRVIDKMRVVRHLREAGLDQPLSLSFETGYGVYRKGDPIQVVLEDRSYSYPVLFDLSSDGHIHFLYPDAALDDPVEVAPDQPLPMKGLTVSEPFGADHLVAIETAKPSAPLMRALSKRHRDTPNIRPLWDDLYYALKDQGPSFAIFPFFSQDRP